MKTLLFAILVCSFSSAKAQEIDSIFVNLYTDSLKKGTYNYINVDGLYTNGTYLPLDSTDIIFTSSHGKFHGNSLWLDPNCNIEKVKLKVVMRNKPGVSKEFEMYIKKKPDDEKLMTNEEVLEKIKEDIRRRGD